MNAKRNLQDDLDTPDLMLADATNVATGTTPVASRKVRMHIPGR